MEVDMTNNLKAYTEKGKKHRRNITSEIQRFVKEHRINKQFLYFPRDYLEDLKSVHNLWSFGIDIVYCVLANQELNENGDSKKEVVETRRLLSFNRSHGIFLTLDPIHCENRN